MSEVLSVVPLPVVYLPAQAEVIRVVEAGPPLSALPEKVDLTVEQVEGLVDELETYHGRFSPLFVREEQREWSLKYLQGLLLPVTPRKAIEPIAETVEGGNVRNMQHFIGQGAWDVRPILQEHQRYVDETLGDPEGVLIVDESGDPKQGSHSAGVAPQYCGKVGKVCNCQVGVFLGYVSAKGYTLVDCQLYLPELWFTPEYAQRRRACGIPQEIPFQTKPEIAWALIQKVVTHQTLRFGWVTFDEAYGENPEFLDRLDGAGLRYLGEVPLSTRVWLTRPQTYVPPAGPVGRPPSRLRLVEGEPEAQRVDQIAEELPAWAWQVWRIKEGSKGSLEAEMAFLRVVAVRDGLPGPDVWLIFRRSTGSSPQLKAYISNAAEDTPYAALVRITGMRWPIETALKDEKDELGQDDDQTRSWQGWHHHRTLTVLAHHFLVTVRLHLGEAAGALTVPQARRLLEAVLPRKRFDAQAAIALIRKTQRQNRAAYLSHRKRTGCRDPS